MITISDPSSLRAATQPSTPRDSKVNSFFVMFQATGRKNCVKDIVAEGKKNTITLELSIDPFIAGHDPVPG